MPPPTKSDTSSTKPTGTAHLNQPNRDLNPFFIFLRRGCQDDFSLAGIELYGILLEAVIRQR